MIAECDLTNNLEFFSNIINTSEGVLEGVGKACRHAVFYRYGTIYDPDGKPIYEFSKEACKAHGFYPQRALVIEDKGFYVSS